jgi:hypothetical protein
MYRYIYPAVTAGLEPATAFLRHVNSVLASPFTHITAPLWGFEPHIFWVTTRCSLLANSRGIFSMLIIFSHYRGLACNAFIGFKPDQDLYNTTIMYYMVVPGGIEPLLLKQEKIDLQSIADTVQLIRHHRKHSIFNEL